MHWINWVMLWLIFSELVAHFCTWAYTKQRGSPCPNRRQTYLILWLLWPFLVIAYPFWRKK